MIDIAPPPFPFAPADAAAADDDTEICDAEGLFRKAFINDLDKIGAGPVPVGEGDGVGLLLFVDVTENAGLCNAGEALDKGDAREDIDVGELRVLIGSGLGRNLSTDGIRVILNPAATGDATAEPAGLIEEVDIDVDDASGELIVGIGEGIPDGRGIPEGDNPAVAGVAGLIVLFCCLR